MTRRAFFVAVLALLTSGCIHRQALAPGMLAATPDTAACSHIRNEQHAFIVAGVIAGALSGAGGTVTGVETDNGQKIATGITAGVLGVGAAILTTISGFEADAYTQEGCK
jgi:hypothetical protein